MQFSKIKFIFKDNDYYLTFSSYLCHFESPVFLNRIYPQFTKTSKSADQRPQRELC